MPSAYCNCWTAVDHRRLRERLAHYRAGATTVAPGTAASDPWPARVAHLRALVQAREQRLAGTRRAEPVAVDVGKEIAPGVMYAERHYESPSTHVLPLPPDRQPDGSDWPEVDAPLLLFDTETTGLGSGAGQWVWMVGMLIYSSKRWFLRQWWLSRPGSECLYLEAIADALPAAFNLLSYNGRSFDVPMLRTRHQLHGLVSPFENRPHLDLLHAVRRRYRGCWSDCRLATVERELLGRQREDDLPGSQAPQAWRSFLRGGSSAAVGQVLEHNRVDLESLVHLVRYLARTHGAKDLPMRC